MCFCWLDIVSILNCNQYEPCSFFLQLAFTYWSFWWLKGLLLQNVTLHYCSLNELLTLTLMLWGGQGCSGAVWGSTDLFIRVGPRGMDHSPLAHSSDEFSRWLSQLVFQKFYCLHCFMSVTIELQCKLSFKICFNQPCRAYHCWAVAYWQYIILW